MRTYYLFRSENDPQLQAFTDDPAGSKLPAENGPWTMVRPVSVDEDWTHTTTRDVVAAGVAANGFLLLTGEGRNDQPASSRPVI